MCLVFLWPCLVVFTYICLQIPAVSSFSIPHQLSSESDNVDNDRYVVGLLSKCSDSSGYRGQTLAMAESMSTHLRAHVSNQSISRQFKNKENENYFYHEVDVCEDERVLIRVLDSFLLQPEWMNRGTEELKIKAIFAFIPEKLLKVVVSFLSFTDIKILPLYTLGFENREWFESFPQNVFPIVEVIGENIVVELIHNFRWKHIAIIDVISNVENVKDRFNLEVVKQDLPGRCLDYKVVPFQSFVTLNMSLEVRTLLDSLKRDETVKVIVVKGRLSALFMQRAKEYGLDKYWIIMAQFRGENRNNPEFVSIFENLGKNIEKAGFNYQKILYHNDTLCNNPYYVHSSTKSRETNNDSPDRKKELKTMCNNQQTVSLAEYSSDDTATTVRNDFSYRKRHFEYASELVAKQVEVFSHLQKKEIVNHISIIQYYNQMGHERSSIKDLLVTKKILKIGSGECRKCATCEEQCQTTKIRNVKSKHLGFTKVIGLLSFTLFYLVVIYFLPDILSLILKMSSNSLILERRALLVILLKILDRKMSVS